MKDTLTAVERYPTLWALFGDIPNNDCPRSVVEAAFESLIQRYQEPHRAYHNVSHLEDLGSLFVQHRSVLTNEQARAVLCALFLHDVVYECRPGLDEAASAAFAETFLLNLRIPEPIIAYATSITRATATHLSDDFATQLFLDMDMSILASRPDIDRRYVEGVTFEFRTKLGTTFQHFAQARAEKFLTPTLEREMPLFTTAPFQDLNARAYANMRCELKGDYASPASEHLIP